MVFWQTLLLAYLAEVQSDPFVLSNIIHALHALVEHVSLQSAGFVSM